jgi:hypothetical protein
MKEEHSEAIKLLTYHGCPKFILEDRVTKLVEEYLNTKHKYPGQSVRDVMEISLYGRGPIWDWLWKRSNRKALKEHKPWGMFHLPWRCDVADHLAQRWGYINWRWFCQSNLHRIKQWMIDLLPWSEYQLLRKQGWTSLKPGEWETNRRIADPRG